MGRYGLCSCMVFAGRVCFGVRKEWESIGRTVSGCCWFVLLLVVKA